MCPVVDNRTRFIFALYDRNAKERRTFDSFVKKLFRNDVDRVVANAVKTQHRISADFSFLPLERVDINPRDVVELKRILQNFVIDICDHIGTEDGGGSPFFIARRTSKFCSEWNKHVNHVNGHFLQGFGDIHFAQLEMNINKVLETFGIVQKCRRVPRPLVQMNERVTAAIQNCANLINALDS